MNNLTEKRVRRQQKKSSHSPQQGMVISSPPTSPQASSMTSRWGNKNVDGGSEDDTSTEKQRGAWTDSSKRKLSPRSSAPDGPTTTDPFAGMKTCINYQQEIERLKTLVPKVENKKRSSQHQQHQHQRNNSVSTIVTEDNLTDTDHHINTDTDTNTTATTAATIVTTSSQPSLSADNDNDNITTNISSTMKMTSVPSSSSSSSSSSRISSNSSSSSLSSSHDSMSSSSLSSVCSPPSSLNSIIPPISHSPMITHEIPSSTHTTSDHLVDIRHPTTSNHLMEPLKNTSSPQIENKAGSSSVITDEEKARFLEFMRSWTGGLNGWNDQPMEHKGFMWNQQSSRPSRPLTRSEPCSPHHQDIRIDPWLQRQHINHHQHQLNHHQYLQQQFHQQLPPTTIQLDMGHRQQQPCFTPTSPPLQSPLSSKSLHHQQHQQLLYSSSMHPQQKQQASFHQQQYQYHSSSSSSHQLHHHHLLHQQQQQHPHSLHLHQQPAMNSKEWYGSSGIKSPSSLTSQVGTIGDRSSSPSVSRTNSRNLGPLSVSVM